MNEYESISSQKMTLWDLMSILESSDYIRRSSWISQSINIPSTVFSINFFSKSFGQMPQVWLSLNRGLSLTPDEPVQFKIKIIQKIRLSQPMLFDLLVLLWRASKLMQSQQLFKYPLLNKQSSLWQVSDMLVLCSSQKNWELYRKIFHNHQTRVFERCIP